MNSIAAFLVGVLLGWLLKWVVDDWIKPKAGPGEEAVEPVATRSAGVTVPGVAEAEAAADDLERIEGIGPKIAGLLADAGIVTFAQLALTPTPRLAEILREAGPRYQIANPASWPEQARLAAVGDWDGLQALQDSLKGGVEQL